MINDDELGGDDDGFDDDDDTFGVGIITHVKQMGIGGFDLYARSSVLHA